jgi:hypothetical protein
MSGPEFGKEKRGLFRLISDVPQLLMQLIRDEIEAFKLELEKKVKGVAVGAGLFAGAAVFALLMVIALMIAAIFGLSLVMPTWAAALVVAAILLIITGVLVLVGLAQVKKGDPGKSAESIKKDLNAIKGIGKRD